MHGGSPPHPNCRPRRSRAFRIWWRRTTSVCLSPAGVPKDIIDTVSAANLKLIADKSYQELLISGTFELEPPMNPAEYKRYVESDLARWRPIVTTMGIKID